MRARAEVTKNDLGKVSRFFFQTNVISANYGVSGSTATVPEERLTIGHSSTTSTPIFLPASQLKKKICYNEMEKYPPFKKTRASRTTGAKGIKFLQEVASFR